MSVLVRPLAAGPTRFLWQGSGGWGNKSAYCALFDPKRIPSSESRLGFRKIDLTMNRFKLRSHTLDRFSDKMGEIKFFRVNLKFSFIDSHKIKHFLETHAGTVVIATCRRSSAVSSSMLAIRSSRS